MYYRKYDYKPTKYKCRICKKFTDGNNIGIRYCDKCFSERQQKKWAFEESHTFYSPEKDCVYKIGYTDELTTEKGYNGKHFTIKRLDTNEIIETDNLWNKGRFGENVDNLPIIEFLTT